MYRNSRATYLYLKRKTSVPFKSKSSVEGYGSGVMTESFFVPWDRDFYMHSIWLMTLSFVKRHSLSVFFVALWFIHDMHLVEYRKYCGKEQKVKNPPQRICVTRALAKNKSFFKHNNACNSQVISVWIHRFVEWKWLGNGNMQRRNAVLKLHYH